MRLRLRSTFGITSRRTTSRIDWLLSSKKASTSCEKEQLSASRRLRDRLPTLEELVLFRAHFAKQNQHKRTRTDMVLVLDGLVLTARRISELCRIERQHVNVEKDVHGL
jgi:hypothetical protein